MNSLTEPGATLAERSLGTMEKFFYLLNQTHPNHFAMEGEIVGPTEIGQWQGRLDQAGRHSAVIWSRIERDSHDVPRFRPAPQGSIPLKVLAYNSGWTAEAGAQMGEPFDELQPPLLRATLLHDADRAIIVLAAHHSIADAMSLTFLLVDLLRAISGQKLVRSRETAAVERLVERKH